MFYVIRAKYIFLVLGLTILAISSIIWFENRTLVPSFAAEQGSALYYIVDAGHGGEDGGAVSSGGVAESGLNLAIAQKSVQLLTFLGKNTAMTRDSERAVYSDGAATLREKKRSDLANRVEKINSYDNAILISIHQNSLPSSPSVQGAQVFYNGAESAQQIAGRVQADLNSAVNGAHSKQEKQISSGIYLMRQVQCPAILVECGFLSNSAEAQRLQEQDHQKKLAAAICAGVLRQENGETDDEGK